jgi:hypothetical protein
MSIRNWGIIPNFRIRVHLYVISAQDRIEVGEKAAPPPDMRKGFAFPKDTLPEEPPLRRLEG